MVDPSPDRSTARRVTAWLVLVSLAVAVAVAGVAWLAAAPRATPSTMFVFAVATVGLWTVVYRLMIVGIKRMVRSRIAQRDAGRT